MPVEIKILRKEGWDLNPDDMLVNNIFRALERCGGHCPCHHKQRHGHDICPCHEYIRYDNCICGLYVRQEIWKDVVGFEDSYEVSSFGRVRGKERVIYKNDGTHQTFKSKILTPYSNNKRNGYCYVYLRVKGKKYPKFVHRLVAEAFLPNTKDLPQINHKDENTTNNRLENLEWCDAKYNNNYGSKSIKYKECAPKAPVSQYTKDGIFMADYPSQREAERKTGISCRNISSCCCGKARTAGGFIWKFKNK